MEVSSQLHALAASSLGSEPEDPLNKRGGGPENYHGHFREEQIFYLWWQSNHNSSVVQPVPYSPYQLFFPIFIVKVSQSFAPE
jgi:hypothetical protein